MTEANTGEFTFYIDRKGSNQYINRQLKDISFTHLKNGMWETSYRHRLYKLFVQEIDYQSKKATIVVNGKKVQVNLKDKSDKLIERLGLQSVFNQQVADARAPMPGLIHSIMVNAGEMVEVGDPLIILEAMKMENVIKASAKGIVDQIHVAPHDSVEKNALLITFK